MLLDGSFHTKIVGVTFKNEDGSDRQRIIRDLIRNEELEEGTELYLVPQPRNPYDRNCILVNAENGKTLGSLSKELAATIAPQIQQGYTFKAYASSYTGGDIGYAYGVNIKIERYKPGSSSDFRHGANYSEQESQPSIFSEKSGETMIKCEVCGSSNIVKQDGSFMCQSCGIRYSLDEIRKMLQNSQQAINEDDEYEEYEDRGVTLQEGDLVFFGEYPFNANDDAKYSIDWIVAEAKDGNFLLLSKYMIDLVQYNTYKEPRTDIPPILDSNGGYQYVWHNSSLREWLNDGFIHEAFDEEEQDALQTRDIAFPEKTYEEDTEYGPMKLVAEPLPNSQDKVFLPSEIEANIPYRLYIGPEWEAKTPYAKSKAQDRKYEYCRQFWNLTQPFSPEYNIAHLSGMGFLGDYISGCPATEHAFLRPMVLVDQKFIYDTINSYTDEFFNYYLECLNKHRESNQKEKERREKARQEYFEQQAAKKAEEERKKEEEKRKAEEAARARKNNPPKEADDSYYEDQGLGFYNGMYYTEESWRETHLNPWGTEDVGDGYIDSDGVFTEY